MEDFTKEELEQLMAVFRDQAALVLEDMSQDILVLENNGADAEAMARVRRAAHTIKGDSACVGLERIADLAHRLEDIIEAARLASLSFDAEVVNLLLESLDEMRAAICGQEISDITPETLERLLDSIRSIELGKQPVVDSKSNGDADPARIFPPEVEGNGAVSSNGSDSEISRISEAISRGRQVFLLELQGDFLDTVRQRLSLPDSPALPIAERIIGDSDGERSTLVVETGLSPESIESWLRAGSAGLENGDALPAEVAWVESVTNGALVTSKISTHKGENGRAPAAPAVQQGPRQRRSAEYVRVEAVRIDTILNLAGEMVIARSTMNQVLPDLEAAFPKNDVVARFSSASVQMGKLIAELQKSILKMRMVPIDQVFKRFNRPMRELAMESGKQIELEVTGAETELDRTLIDLIYEPLLHLLRNAVDHGLEWPAEREAAGKSPTGKIRMRAYHEGNQVVVEVSDDGRGIDIKSLKAKAVEANEITQAQANQATDDEA
ncbi:MAG: chemotaxis protein CheA, partial [Blastocatellia bacterium]